jgi:hypothetical protein
MCKPCHFYDGVFLFKKILLVIFIDVSLLLNYYMLQIIKIVIMTKTQRENLEELETRVFEFINEIDDDDCRFDCAIGIIVQSITAGERRFNDHKNILNESGKLYRKVRKEILLEDGCWEDYIGENDNIGK